MCHFITLVAPIAEAPEVRRVMREFGRTATPIHNPSLAKITRPREHQYLTSRSCDCGTALAGTASDDVAEARNDAERLRRKGWSDAKIARSLAASGKAATRPPTRGPDSFELWVNIINALSEQLQLSSVGLFVHSYSGGIQDEAFTATRREIGKGAAVLPALRDLGEDDLIVFNTSH